MQTHEICCYDTMKGIFIGSFGNSYTFKGIFIPCKSASVLHKVTSHNCQKHARALRLFRRIDLFVECIAPVLRALCAFMCIVGASLHA